MSIEITTDTPTDIGMTLAKSGEDVIDVALKRDRVGLKIIARTHPSMEQLFRSWGNGQSTRVSTYSPNWISPALKPLEVWNLSQHTGLQYGENERFSFRFDAPGHPLIMGDGTVNASVLRLVGIGSGGVEVKFEEPISTEMMRTVAQQLLKIGRKVYSDFLLPVEVRVRVSVEERRL